MRVTTSSPPDILFSRSTEPLVRRLSALSQLSRADMAVLDRLAAQPTTHQARTELVATRRPGPNLLMAAGWACRQRVLSDGRRQIVSFALPGDLLTSLMRPTLTPPCAAVSLTMVVTIDATPLIAHANASGGDQDGLPRALQLLDRLDDVLLRDHVVRLGRQTAYERMVHLILEFYERLATVGLVNGDSFPMPLTQEVLADALGISVVHVNRVLQQIRRDKLLDLRAGRVTILDLAQMQDIADWVPQPGRADAM